MTNLKSITKNALAVLLCVALSFTIGFSLLFKTSRADINTEVTLSDLNTMGINFTAQKTKIREAVTSYDSSSKEITYGFMENEKGIGSFNYLAQQNFYKLYTTVKDEHENNIFSEAKVYSTTASSTPGGTYDSGSFLPVDYGNANLYYKDYNGDYQNVFYDKTLNSESIAAPSGTSYIIQNYETKNNLTKGITNTERVDNLYLSFGDYYTVDHELDTILVSLQVAARLYNNTTGKDGVGVGTKTDDINMSGEDVTYFGNVIPQSTLNINNSTNTARNNYFWYAYLDLENIYCVQEHSNYSQGTRIADAEGKYVVTITFSTYNIETDQTSNHYLKYEFYLINEDSFVNYPEFNESVIEGDANNMQVDYRNYYYNYLNRDYPTYNYDPTKFNISFEHNYNDELHEYSTTFKKTALYTNDKNANTNVTYDVNLYSVFENEYSKAENSSDFVVTKKFNYSIATLSVIDNSKRESENVITTYHFFYKSKAGTNEFTYADLLQESVSSDVKKLTLIAKTKANSNSATTTAPFLDKFEFMYSDKVVYEFKEFDFKDSDSNNTYISDVKVNYIETFNSLVDSLDYDNLLDISAIDTYIQERLDTENDEEYDPNPKSAYETPYNKELTLDINYYDINETTNNISRNYINYYFQANTELDKDLMLINKDEFEKINFKEFLKETFFKAETDIVDTNYYFASLKTTLNNDIFKPTETNITNLNELLFKDYIDSEPEPATEPEPTPNLNNYLKNYTIINSVYAFANGSLNSAGSKVENIAYYNLGLEEPVISTDNNIIITNNINFKNDYDKINSDNKSVYSVNAINNIVDIKNKKDLSIKLEFSKLGRFNVLTDYAVSSPMTEEYAVCSNITSYTLKVNVNDDRTNDAGTLIKGISITNEDIIAISGLPLDRLESANGGLKEETVGNPTYENYKHTYTPIYLKLVGEEYLDNDDKEKYAQVTGKLNGEGAEIKATYVCKVEDYIVSYRKQQTLTVSYSNGTIKSSTYSNDIYDYRKLGFDLFVVQDVNNPNLTTGRYFAYKTTGSNTFTFVSKFIDYNSGDGNFYIINKEYSNLSNQASLDQVYSGQIHDYTSTTVEGATIDVKIAITNSTSKDDILFADQKIVNIINNNNTTIYKGYYDEKENIITLTEKFDSTDGVNKLRKLRMSDKEEFLEQYTGADNIDKTTNEHLAVIKNKFTLTENGLFMNFSSGILANSFRYVTYTSEDKEIFSYQTSTNASDQNRTFDFTYEKVGEKLSGGEADILLKETGQSIFYAGTKTYYVNTKENNILSAYNLHNNQINTYTTKFVSDHLLVNEGDDAYTSIAPNFKGFQLLHVTESNNCHIYAKLDGTNITHILAIVPNSNINGYFYTLANNVSYTTFLTAISDKNFTFSDIAGSSTTFTGHKHDGTSSIITNSSTDIEKITVPPSSDDTYTFFGNKTSKYVYDETAKKIKLVVNLTHDTNFDSNDKYNITGANFVGAGISEGGFNYIKSETVNGGNYKIYEGNDLFNLNSESGQMIYLVVKTNSPNAGSAYLLGSSSSLNTQILTQNMLDNAIAKGSTGNSSEAFNFTKTKTDNSYAFVLRTNDYDLIEDGKTLNYTVSQYSNKEDENNRTFNGYYNGNPVRIEYNKLKNDTTNLEVKIYNINTDKEVLTYTGYYVKKFDISIAEKKDSQLFKDVKITGSKDNSYITTYNLNTSFAQPILYGDNLNYFNEFANKTFKLQHPDVSGYAQYDYTYLNSDNSTTTLSIFVKFEETKISNIYFKKNSSDIENTSGYKDFAQVYIDEEYFNMIINNKENEGIIKNHTSLTEVVSGYKEVTDTNNPTNTIDQILTSKFTQKEHYKGYYIYDNTTKSYVLIDDDNYNDEYFITLYNGSNMDSCSIPYTLDNNYVITQNGEQVQLLSGNYTPINVTNYDAYEQAFENLGSKGTNDEYAGKYIIKNDSKGDQYFVKVTKDNQYTVGITTGITDSYDITFTSGTAYGNKEGYYGKYFLDETLSYEDYHLVNYNYDFDKNYYNISASITKAYKPKVVPLVYNNADPTNNTLEKLNPSNNIKDYIDTFVTKDNVTYYYITADNYKTYEANKILVVGTNGSDRYTLKQDHTEDTYYKKVGVLPATKVEMYKYVGNYYRTDLNATYYQITKEDVDNNKLSAFIGKDIYIPLQFEETSTKTKNEDYKYFYIKIAKPKYILITEDNFNDLSIITNSTLAYTIAKNKMESTPSTAEEYNGKYIYLENDPTKECMLVSSNVHKANDGQIYFFDKVSKLYKLSGVNKTTLTFATGEFSNRFSKKTIVSEFQDIIVQSSGISTHGKTLHLLGNVGLFNKDGYVEFKDETKEIYSDVTNDLNDYYKYDFTTPKDSSLELFNNHTNPNKKEQNLYNLLDINASDKNTYWQGITLKKQEGSTNVYEPIAGQIPVTNLPPVKFNYYCTYAYKGLVSESYVYRYKNYKIDEFNNVTVIKTNSDEKWIEYDNKGNNFDYYTELFTKNTILNDDGYYEIIIKFTYDSYDIGNKAKEVFYQVFNFVIDKTDPEFILEKEVEKVYKSNNTDKDNNTTYLTWANYENNYYTNGNVRISWQIPTYFQAPINPYLSKVNYSGITVGTNGSLATPANQDKKFPNTTFIPFNQTLRQGRTTKGIEQSYIYKYITVSEYEKLTNEVYKGTTYRYNSQTESYEIAENGGYVKTVVKLRDSANLDAGTLALNQTRNGYYLEKSNRYYLYFFSDNSSSADLTYWGSGNYQIRFTYGSSSLSYSTTSFKVDTIDISGMQIIPITKNDAGYVYSDIHFTSGSDSYINQPFTFIYNKKASGAPISTSYYKIPFKDIDTDTLQLLLSNNTLGISADSIINGVSNNSNTEKPYYYNYNINKPGQQIKSGNEFVPDDSCLFMFKLKDSAGNTANYFTLYDKTTPNYLINTDEDYNERYNIVTDTADVIWGDYKAIEIKSALYKTIENGNVSITNQGYVNNHYVFDNADDPTATTLSIILKDIVLDSSRINKKYKGSIVRRFLRVETLDNVTYYELNYDANTKMYKSFRDGVWQNEIALNESDIRYFLFVPLQKVRVEYYKTNSDDVKHYQYEYNISTTTVPTQMQNKLVGKFENHATAYPKLHVMQEALEKLNLPNYSQYTLQGPYGFYGEQQYYFTILDILNNETLTTLWMNFDKAQAFGKGNFYLANASSLDDLYASYLDLESAFSISQLFFSYYPESHDEGIPASEITYKHYDFNYNYGDYEITNIKFDETFQKYTITFKDGQVQEINIAKYDENERSEPNSSYPFNIKPTLDNWTLVSNEDKVGEDPTKTSNFYDVYDTERWYSSTINPTVSTETLQNATQQGLYVFKRVYVNYIQTDESGKIQYITYEDEHDAYQTQISGWYKEDSSDFNSWVNYVVAKYDDDNQTNNNYNGDFWLATNEKNLKSYPELEKLVFNAHKSNTLFNNLEIDRVLEKLIWEKISADLGYVVVDLGYDTITRYYVYYVDRNGVISNVAQFGSSGLNISEEIGGDISYVLGSKIDGVSNYKGGYEFTYPIKDIIKQGTPDNPDEYAYTSGATNNLFNTNKEYVEFNIPLDKYNENKIFTNFMLKFIKKENDIYQVKDGKGLVQAIDGVYKIYNSSNQLIDSGKEDMIFKYGIYDYQKVNTFLNPDITKYPEAESSTYLYSYLKNLFNLTSLSDEILNNLDFETRVSYNKIMFDEISSYLNRTMFNIYSETVFELNLSLTLLNFGNITSNNPNPYLMPIYNNESNSSKTNDSNKYVLTDGNIKDKIPDSIDRVDEDITSLYLFQPIDENSKNNGYYVDLKDTSGVWVLNNQYANEYKMDFLINNNIPKGDFYGKNDGNYKTNQEENNYAQNMFDVDKETEKNDLAHMIKQDTLSVQGEQNGLTILKSTNNKTLLFVFSDDESVQDEAKINPYEITITKEYINNSGNYTTETIFQRSKSSYPNAQEQNYIYHNDATKAEKMRMAFIENLDSSDLTHRQWGIVIFDGYAKNEAYHNLLSRPEDNAIYKVKLQYYGNESNYTYYDVISGSNNNINNNVVTNSNTKTVSYFYGNFEIIEDNIKPLYNLIQLMDLDNFIPKNSEMNLNKVLSKINGVNTTNYTGIDKLLLQYLKSNFNLDLENSPETSIKDLFTAWARTFVTSNNTSTSTLTSKNKLYIQYAMNLIFEEYYKSYKDKTPSYYKDDKGNNILEKDYIQNYFFAVTEDFNFSQITSLDSNNVYFRRIANINDEKYDENISNYRFSLTLDDFNESVGDLTNENHQVFIESMADGLTMNDGKLDNPIENNKFYSLHFSVDNSNPYNIIKSLKTINDDNVTNYDPLDDYTISVKSLIDIGVFNYGDYIEIIESDEAGNYRVYGIHITTKYNGLNYSYLDNRNYKLNKTIGVENNTYKATINGTGFDIGNGSNTGYIQYSEKTLTNNKYNYTPSTTQDGFLKAEISYRFSRNTGTIDDPKYLSEYTFIQNDQQITEKYYNNVPITIYLNPINRKLTINYGDCSLIYIYKFTEDEELNKKEFFNASDFEDVIEKICSSITYSYGDIATDFRINVNFIERAGENISVTYNYPGAHLKYRKTYSSTGLTITIPEDSDFRSTIIVNFHAYRYKDGDWQLIDQDDNGIRIYQGDGITSLGGPKGSNGTSYFFGPGTYKFTLVDNFGRSKTYHEAVQVGSVEPELIFKNSKVLDGETYTAQAVHLQYDATIFVPYLFYYFENGQVNTTALDLVDGINNKIINNLEYVIEVKKSSSYSDGNVKIITITPPSGEFKTKFEFHLLNISTGDFEDVDYTYNLELDEDKKDLLKVKSFNFYTILPKLEVQSLSGLVLDAKNQNFIEDLKLIMNTKGVELDFNPKIVIIRNHENKKVTFESFEPFTVTETGDYTVYITNDLKHNSEQIEFHRKSGSAVYYSVLASKSYNTSSFELIASTKTENIGTYSNKINDIDKNDTKPVYQYFAQKTYDNYKNFTLENFTLNLSIDHIEIITNTNRGIDCKLIYIDQSNNATNYVIYSIIMGTSTETAQVIRYIKITFIDPDQSNFSKFEIVDNYGYQVPNCNKDNIHKSNNVKTVSDYIVARFYNEVDKNHEANEYYIEHYVNNNPKAEIIRINTLPTETIEDENGLKTTFYYFKTNITGLHKFIIYDLAGNRTLFGVIENQGSGSGSNVVTTGDPYFNIFLINGVRYSLNSDEDSINNRIYNGEVLLSIIYSIRTEHTTIALYGDNVEITATKNGQLYNIVEQSANLFKFSESGYYEVTLNGLVILGNEETSQQKVTTKFAFRIVNPNTAIASFDISKSKQFTLLQLEKKTENTENSYFVPINVDYYNQQLAINHPNLTLWLNTFDDNSGNGYYYVKARSYVESIGDYKEFDFYVWINEEYPSINCNKEYGSTTKDVITLSYNPYSIYSMLGNSKIVITRNTTIVDTIVIDSTATNEIATYSIRQKGEYWIQIYTEDDKLITSYKITKKDPLNSTAVLIIIIVCVGVVVLTVIFIILRRRARFK